LPRLRVDRTPVAAGPDDASTRAQDEVDLTESEQLEGR